MSAPGGFEGLGRPDLRLHAGGDGLGAGETTPDIDPCSEPISVVEAGDVSAAFAGLRTYACRPSKLEPKTVVMALG